MGDFGDALGGFAAGVARGGLSILDESIATDIAMDRQSKLDELALTRQKSLNKINEQQQYRSSASGYVDAETGAPIPNYMASTYKGKKVPQSTYNSKLAEQAIRDKARISREVNMDPSQVEYRKQMSDEETSGVLDKTEKLMMKQEEVKSKIIKQKIDAIDSDPDISADDKTTMKNTLRGIPPKKGMTSAEYAKLMAQTGKSWDDLLKLDNGEDIQKGYIERAGSLELGKMLYQTESIGGVKGGAVASKADRIERETQKNLAIAERSLKSGKTPDVVISELRAAGASVAADILEEQLVQSEQGVLQRENKPHMIPSGAVSTI